MKETIWTKIKRKKYEAKRRIRERSMKIKAWFEIKTSMKKRAVKEWASETFHKKRNMIRRLEAEAAAKDNEIERLKERFRRLGNQIETMEMDGRLRTITTKIELEPIQFGNYIMTEYGSREDWNEMVLKEAKGRLVEMLAHALMESNMVQFIIRDQCAYGGPFDELTTVAAKIAVVPWEQLAKGSKIEIMRTHI